MAAHRRLNAVKADNHVAGKVRAVVKAGRGAIGILFDLDTALAEVGDALWQVGDDSI